jgi:predicted amidophosphoribosyltransferase
VAEALKEAFKLRNDIDLNLLERAEHLDPQSSLEHDYALRAGHIKGAFRVNNTPPEHVVLVDDVATTGATAGEAAEALIMAGAKRVDLVALAIGA